MIGSEISSAAQSPTRSERRTSRGLRAPNACAASGATADTSPIPKVKLTKKTVFASAAAATASIAEASDQGQIGRHHRDLPKLRQRDRHRQLERLGQFNGEVMAGWRRDAGRCDRSSLDFIQRCHGDDTSTVARPKG